MKVEKVHEGIRYTLSNDDLQVNDEVFSIGSGRCLGGDDWILHDFRWTDFPHDPATILELKHSDYKPYEVRTTQGYSPRESYYKIIKKEKQVPEREEREGDIFLPPLIWVEILD